jgi:hypothetical protein
MERQRKFMLSLLAAGGIVAGAELSHVEWLAETHCVSPDGVKQVEAELGVPIPVP